MKPRIQSPSRLSFPLASAIATLLASSSSLHAADATWGANGNSAWYTGANWAGGAFPGLQGVAASNTDIATFTSAFTATQAGINMGTNSLNLGAISLDGSRITATSIGNSSGTAGVLRLYGATVSGVNNVILNNAGTGLLTLQAAQSGTMGVVLSNATNNIIRITNTGGVTISSIVSGSGSNLTLQGSGTGVLTLTGANTYSGVTTLNAGPTANSGNLTLSGTATGTILNTSGITLNGGILQLTNASAANVADRVNDTATITSNGGRINFANTNTSGQTYAETLGTVALTTSHLVFNQTVHNSSSSGQTLTLSGLTRTGASNTSIVSFIAPTTGPQASGNKNMFVVSSGATNDATGIIGAWAVTNNLLNGSATAGMPDYAKFDGSGYVVPLGASAITTEAGIVTNGNVNWTATTTVGLTATRTINTLRMSASSGTYTVNLGANNLETSGILAAGGGGMAINNTSGQTGSLTIPSPGGTAGESASLYVSTAGRSLILGVAIKDNVNSKLTLVKSGQGGLTNGSLQLNNTGNSYSGDTVVNDGDLNLGASNVVPNGTGKGNLVLDGSNSRFVMTLPTPGTAFSETINGLNGRGTVVGGSSVASNTTSTLTVGSGDTNGNFSGSLVNNVGGALALTKTGAGTQTLSGVSTYTGATNVNGGKLVVNGSISTSTLTTVAVGATLEGVGTIGKAIINGTLAVGNSPGTMTFTDTLGLNGATLMEIDGTSGAGVAGGHDFVNLTGSGAAGILTTGSTMTLDMGVIFSVGTYSWNLFDMASETGTFASISLADQYSGSLINTSGVWDLTSGDNTWQFTESTGVLGLTVIPEPRAALLGGLGLLALLRRRR